MEVCEDMSMELQFCNMRKRQCMGDVAEHPNNKRQCTGLGSLANGDGLLFNQFNECDMLYWQMQISTEQTKSMPGLVPKPEIQMDCMAFENQESGASTQPCQRCIAGESGHINHILGL
ncbi:uncharacterized protein C10orf143-like isoform X2 [Spea bombifrons]|nr:uncharacterized protein C10orf143-like isoform X2 [Spea bombifrons]